MRGGFQRKTGPGARPGERGSGREGQEGRPGGLLSPAPAAGPPRVPPALPRASSAPGGGSLLPRATARPSGPSCTSTTRSVDLGRPSCGRAREALRSRRERGRGHEAPHGHSGCVGTDSLQRTRDGTVTWLRQGRREPENCSLRSPRHSPAAVPPQGQGRARAPGGLPLRRHPLEPPRPVHARCLARAEARPLPGRRRLPGQGLLPGPSWGWGDPEGGIRLGVGEGPLARLLRQPPPTPRH